MNRASTTSLIREARASDVDALIRLMAQLDYPGTEGFMSRRLDEIRDDPRETLLVVERNGFVAAGLSLSFIPQLALAGDFARISYFVVDETCRSDGLGKALFEKACDLARQRGCDRFEVHCHSRRSAAHEFYASLGFVEAPRYLIKPLP